MNKLKDIKAKIEELEKKIRELGEVKMKTNSNNYDVKIVTSLEQVIMLTKIGYDCQPIGDNRWLMRKIQP